ncbi:MAG: L,D-transpeptidase [Actinomycetota bacterium]
MTRSRVVLMVAWGLLAVGSVVQFAQSGQGSTAPGPEPIDGEDVLAAATPARLPATATDADDGPDEAHDPDEADGATAAGPWPLVDDPASWPTPPAPPATVATVVGDGVGSRPEPGAGTVTHWFPNPTQFDGDRTFLVVDDTSSDDWVKVSLPVMPNGQEGWIPRSAVELSTVTHRAEVDLSDATVTVWDGDDLVLTTSAVTGRPATLTPLGRFYIRDIIAQPVPDGDYGPWILALSGFSEVLSSFQGGLPALALHGTDEPGQLGSAISAGCVRVSNEVISALAATVPLGTPVTIVA